MVFGGVIDVRRTSRRNSGVEAIGQHDLLKPTARQMFYHNIPTTIAHGRAQRDSQLMPCLLRCLFSYHIFEVYPVKKFPSDGPIHANFLLTNLL